MNRRTFLVFGVLGLAGIAGCGGGDSALQQGQWQRASSDSRKDVVFQSRYRDAADLVGVQAQLNARGDVLCCVTGREQNSRSSDFTAEVVLYRADRKSEVLASLGGAGQGLVGFRDPCLDVSADHPSWIEERGRSNSISYRAPGGKIALWRPPSWTRFVGNLGVQRAGDELHLYAVAESRGQSTLLRLDHSTGVVAAYTLNGIRPGTLEMTFERGCRYGLGVASDGLSQQLFYLDNGRVPSVQVLENEPVQTYAINSAGEVSYLKTDGSLFCLQRTSDHGLQGGVAVPQPLPGSTSAESVDRITGTVATESSSGGLVELYRLGRSDFGLLLDDVSKISIQSLSGLGLTVLYAPEVDFGLAVSVDGRPRDVYWRDYWNEGARLQSLTAAGPFHCATVRGVDGATSTLEVVRFKIL